MKVYEKMGIDLTTQEGFTKLISIGCNDIPDGKDYESCRYVDYASCERCLSERLFAEVPMKKVKRWGTYNGDFVKAYKEWDTASPCPVECPDDAKDCVNCFAQWLMEEIEVEDVEEPCLPTHKQ